MCSKVDNPKEIIKNAKAYWLKGNEPEKLWFDVEARLCECGSTWWARSKEEGFWVECEPEGKV